MRKKVLISAYACEPGMGSEGGVGWNFVCQLAAKHDLWVLTRANNQEVIEADADPAVAGVNFVYVDLPRWLRFWKKGKRGHQLYYILWQIWILFATRKLRRELSFDLIHHITFGRYWIPSLLALAVEISSSGQLEVANRHRTSWPEPTGKRGRRSERLRDFVRGTRALEPARPHRLEARGRDAGGDCADRRGAREAQGVNPFELLPQSGISAAELDFFDEIHQPVPERAATLVSACRHEHWKACTYRSGRSHRSAAITRSYATISSAVGRSSRISRRWWQSWGWGAGGLPRALADPGGCVQGDGRGALVPPPGTA